ncbi:MAG: MlaD family protein [Arhodomonas sp.]|nr:MlaD family protein [Arhodomonas sp.]
MGSRVSYTVVGVFVVVLTAALVATGLWLASGLRQGETRLYSIYLTDSAAGLGRDSPVSYRGVDVGQVRELDIDPSDPRRVHVVVALRADLPVREGISATLKMRGVTGIAYLDLSGGAPDAPPLQAPADEPYPVIPYQESLLMRLDTAVSEGLDSLDELTRQVSETLSEDNRRALAETLANLARLTDTLAEQSERIDGMARRSEEVLDGVNESVARLPDTLAAVEAAARSLQRTAGRFSEAGTELTGLGESGREGIRRLNEDTLPRINALTEELRRASGQLERTLESLFPGAAAAPLWSGPPGTRTGER